MGGGLNGWDWEAWGENQNKIGWRTWTWETHDGFQNTCYQMGEKKKRTKKVAMSDPVQKLDFMSPDERGVTIVFWKQALVFRGKKNWTKGHEPKQDITLWVKIRVQIKEGGGGLLRY